METDNHVDRDRKESIKVFENRIPENGRREKNLSKRFYSL